MYRYFEGCVDYVQIDYKYYNFGLYVIDLILFYLKYCLGAWVTD